MERNANRPTNYISSMRKYDKMQESGNTTEQHAAKLDVNKELVVNKKICYLFYCEMNKFETTANYGLAI